MESVSKLHITLVLPIVTRFSLPRLRELTSILTYLGSVEEQADGSTIIISLSNPDVAPIVTHHLDTVKPRSPRNVRAPRAGWPDGGCWTYGLDHIGVDESVAGLLEWYVSLRLIPPLPH